LALPFPIPPHVLPPAFILFARIDAVTIIINGHCP
jgi:hypothetical protein